jgi:LPXTG-site transpeptidase (sortase) family protein
MKRRIRRVFEGTLLVSGIACLSIWGWSVLREGVYEDWQNWAIDRQAAGQDASFLSWMKDRASGTANPPPAPAEPSLPGAPIPGEGQTNPPQENPPKDESLIGRLKIPRLNVQAVIREGTAERTLSIALGHIAGTAKPGQNGNVGLAGHRDSLFRGLRNIRKNDRIELETSNGETYTYQVTSTNIVKPTEVSVLKAGLYPELTLVTCYPFNYIGSAPERFIVKARQIGQVTKGLETEIAEANPTQASPSAGAPAPEPNTAPAAATPTAMPAQDARYTRSSADRTAGRKVPFEVTPNHSRQLAPGISIGVTRADARNKTVDGWMWVMPDRRTIWLRDQTMHQPIVVHGSDGRRREVVIDSISRGSVRGYLVL